MIHKSFVLKSSKTLTSSSDLHYLVSSLCLRCLMRGQTKKKRQCLCRGAGMFATHQRVTQALRPATSKIFWISCAALSFVPGPVPRRRRAVTTIREYSY